MTTKEAIFEKLEKFLEVRKLSDGGYAPVESQEVCDLADLLREVLALKYEQDPDGDLPISFQLVDRTRYEAPLYLPIRLASRPENGESEMDLHLAAMENYGHIAKWAQDMQAHHLRRFNFLLGEATERHSPLSFKGVTYRVPPPKGLTVEQVRDAASERCAKALAEGRPCPEDHMERQRWAAKIAGEVSEQFGIRVFGSARFASGKAKLELHVPCLQVRIRIDCEGSTA